MAEYNNSDIMNFSMELDNHLEGISNHNQPPSPMEKTFKHHSQEQNEIVFGMEYLPFNGQSELNYNGTNNHAVGGILPSTSADYSDLELHKYLNFDSTVEQNPSKEDLDTRQNQSIDDFFHDFYEIVSSEMKTSSPYEPIHNAATTDTVSFSDHSKNYTSADTGGEFNLDLAQFYVNSESDFLNSMLQPPDLKVDSSNMMIHQPHSQFDSNCRDKQIDDHVEFSVVDLSNEAVEVAGHLHENTEISENAQYSQFYVVNKVNGDCNGGSNEDNSIITYIDQDALQSVEYINECGQTETVMYLNQQSDVKHVDKNVEGVQYEIIDFDTYQYQIENIDSQHQNQNDHSLVELGVPNGQVQYYGDSVEYGQPMDILSSLLSDKNNKVTVQAKPFRNPKTRPSTDEFYLKWQEIDSNPTNICFSKSHGRKGSRKQKLELINQTESVEAKRGRPKTNGAPMMTTTSHIPETPKLPSKYVRDRKKKMQARRKRPRKLTWDSESDYDNAENCNDVKVT